MMVPAFVWMTIGVSGCAILASACLFSVAANSHSALFFTLWVATPYLGHCGLALAHKRNAHGLAVIMVGTFVAAVASVGLFYTDLQPVIAARAEGVEPPMNCAGPWLEFALPIYQWIFVGLLALI